MEINTIKLDTAIYNARNEGEATLRYNIEEFNREDLMELMVRLYDHPLVKGLMLSVDDTTKMYDYKELIIDLYYINK